MIHIDGFDQFAGAPLSDAMIRAGYEYDGDLVPVAGRSAGSLAIACVNSSFSRLVTWVDDKFTLGFAATFSARGSLAWMVLGGENLVLWLNPTTGMPTLNDAIGNALPIKNTWYYYELELDRVAETASLFINAKPDAVFSLTPAMLAADEIAVNFGTLAPSEYRPGVTDPDLGVKTIDDMYLRGDVRLDPIVVTTRYPNSDELVEWFKAGPSSTHAGIVGALPPDLLDAYLASDTVGKTDKFKSSNTLPTTNPIVGTALYVIARKSPSLDAQLTVFMGGDGGAESRESTLAVDENWQAQYACFDQVGSDTKANIEDAAFGITVAAP